MPGSGLPTDTALEITDLNLDGFERVVRITHAATDLRAYVALHNLALGPGLGGCRMYPYANEAAATADVCALARGMSYKNALAGIPFGGGKAVIVGDRASKTPAMLAAFGRALNQLGGTYLTAEDSGIDAADMAIMAAGSQYVAGASTGARAGGGNPAPFTARGVFAGLCCAVASRLGAQRLTGLTVGVEGLGQVGWALSELLRDAGAHVIGTDIDSTRMAAAANQLGITTVAPADLLRQQLDVFAPCALGGAVALSRLAELRAPVIAGAANNQLEAPALGDVLARRGQLYAPDYVINAGGVMSIGGEYLGCWSPAWLNEQLERIPVALEQIFATAAATGTATSLIADRQAREIIRSAPCNKRVARSA